ncbi:MAG TPA: DUF58 domain-containing protein [Solirubrobacterales bacterium]|jgi:uncharacterized protein (DUF58 family)
MPAAPTAAGFGAALILAGLGFGSPSLLVPGIGLLGLAVLAVGWVGLATPSRLIRAPGPARVVEEQPFRLQIRAVGGLLRLPGGELTDPVLDAPVSVGPGWRRRLDVEVRLSGRGRRRLEPARLVVRDPIGLFTRVVSSDQIPELLVLPRIDAVVVAGRGAGGSSVLAGLEDGGAAGRLDSRAIELEVDGLRAYREGSPASRIHWPAVARTGELIERRLVAGADTAPLVVLDASRPSSPEALDAAVRAAASLCWHLAQAGGCGLLLPGDRRAAELETELRGWGQAHARLALVEEARTAPGLARAQRAGAVFWVTARSHPALPTGLRTASGPRYLVGPSVSGRGNPALLVSGCEGRRIGARASRPLERAA